MSDHTTARTYAFRRSEDGLPICPRTDLHDDTHTLWLKFNSAKFSKWECLECGRDFTLSVREVPVPKEANE